MPNTDQQAYGEWAKKTVCTILKAPGLVEFRAYPSTYPGQSTEQSNPALEDPPGRGQPAAQRGKNKDAKAQFQTALKVVQDIAKGLTDGALKEGYLQSDPIQELLSQAQGGQNQVKGGIYG